jgi:uncharacterized protein
LTLFRIEVKAGQEVVAAINEELERRAVTAGAIISLIGAVDSVCVSTMPRDDARADILREYTEPFELTGNGEIRDGKAHIHCVLGSADGTALAGHLHWACVQTWFVHAFVQPLADSESSHGTSAGAHAGMEMPTGATIGEGAAAGSGSSSK